MCVCGALRVERLSARRVTNHIEHFVYVWLCVWVYFQSTPKSQAARALSANIFQWKGNNNNDKIICKIEMAAQRGMPLQR